MANLKESAVDKESGRRLSSGRTMLSGAGEKVLAAVDDGVTNRWEAALTRATMTTATSVDGRVDEVTKPFRRELAIAGGLVGGSAAVPGIGTATAVAASVGELGWSTVRLADLILTVAAVHGHEQSTIEDRRLWVLSVLAYGETASIAVTRLSSELGRGVGKQAMGRVSGESLRQINKALGRTILTKYGTKRGVLALGRAVPFGVGAGVGYGLNRFIVVRTSKHANSFFTDLPLTGMVPLESGS